MAIYVWCHSHRFSLVVEGTIKFCTVMQQFFGILEEIHSFMNGHRRHGTLVEYLKKGEKDSPREKQHLGKRRLKRVSTTRWSSRHAACTTLLSCFREVIQCLDVIAKDEESSKESITQAIGLKTRMLTFDFIATLKICVTIFNVLAPTTIWL